MSSFLVAQSLAGASPLLLPAAGGRHGAPGSRERGTGRSHPRVCPAAKDGITAFAKPF